jgi:dTDP-4-dehydrorhamnose 3,5-epimerase
MKNKKPFVKSLQVHLDDRGYLFEILRSDDLFYEGFGQAYISTINPNAIKGFHVHERKTDIVTCIHGQVKFVVIESDEDNNLVNLYEIHLSPMNRNLVVVPPGLWHGWMCIGSKEAILVNITTEPFDKLDIDEVRVDPINNPWTYKWEIKHG